MEQLIKISTNETGNQVVSAKDLHFFLEVKETFSDWASRMVGYGFVENIDYQAITVFVPHTNGVGGTNKKDYALSLDCAKEISMIQRTEKGKQARQYFLECERIAKNPAANLTKIDLAKMLIESEEQRLSTEKKLLEANSKIEQDAPKVLFASAVSASSTCVLIKELAAYLSQNGFQIGEKKLFEQLRFHGFLCFKGQYYNLPSQKSISLKLFEVKKTAIHKPNGTILTSNTTLVTGKGLEYFLNFFLKQSKAA